ncbi:MAG: hypothetical protein H6830_01590 [Planctomycetes bacterium]|nr:hypothetical protein [Planctomycetota bacterium]MCB9910335.1 hypothetical protein [Planctomycetota bacterium]MCB9912054.1 hypothetical protein [Planctomycetota bacterium]
MAPSTRPPLFASTQTREAFAWDVLDCDEVLGLFLPFCASSLGQRALAECVPREAADAQAGLERLREMQALVRAGSPPNLAGFADPLPADPMDLRTYDEERFALLRGFLDAALRLRPWFEERRDLAPELAALVVSIPDVAPILARIDQTVDERGRVRREASTLLLGLDQKIDALTAERTAILRTVLARSEVRAVLSDNVLHRRGGRPVLVVRAKSAGRIRGIVHDTSQSGESVFIEPREVIEIGNRLAAAEADHAREVQRVLFELTRSIIDRIDRVHTAASLLAEVEWAWIGAGFAKVYGAVAASQGKPTEGSRGLVLRQVRHPLLLDQKQTGQLAEVVPIDLRLGDSFDMLIITGPNTGGKTLALKTAGLFSVLTRLALPVPAAEGTQIPLYSGICADIGDEQEIRQNLSTFASHLVRIRAGLERADPATLVLLDELGGGTDPEEGAALGEAVLETLLRRGVPTLVSTHIGRLKEFAFRHPRAENACTEFDLETLAPKYSLLLGTPGESGALVIARRLGVPEEVVALAEARMQRRDSELLELMGDVRKARVEAEATRKHAEASLDDARATALELQERAQELERRSEQLEKEAQKGLEERLRDGMRNLDRARTFLSQMPKEVAQALGTLLDQLSADLSGATLTDRRQSFIQSLGKGSLVYLPRYRQRVMVHKVDRDRRIVVCKLGSMKIQVPFDEVTPYEAL